MAILKTVFEWLGIPGRVGGAIFILTILLTYAVTQFLGLELRLSFMVGTGFLLSLAAAAGMFLYSRFKNRHAP